jgi:protein arginine kinase activator
MICSQCKQNEASVHFSGIVNGKSLNLELCEACAKASGLVAPLSGFGAGDFFTSPFSFATAAPALGDIMDFLSNWHAKSPNKPVVKENCPACHWSMVDFQKTGRMGCSECYLHFETETKNMLKKIHGMTTHKGKEAPTEVAKAKVRDKEKLVAKIRAALKKAIEDEQFEEAAALRDKLREMEGKSQ